MNTDVLFGIYLTENQKETGEKLELYKDGTFHLTQKEYANDEERIKEIQKVLKNYKITETIIVKPTDDVVYQEQSLNFCKKEKE